jgi:cysteine desulfurase / selenocysteine lyase
MSRFTSDFPIFQYDKDLIYLDSAATSQKPRAVIDAVNEFYTGYNSNIHRGLYPIAEKATSSVESVRKKAADFIKAHDQSEIIFTQGTTIGLNTIAFGLRKYIKKNDVILLSEVEHHSNIVPWQRLAYESGAKLLYLTLTDTGEIGEEVINTQGEVLYTNISEIPNLRIVSVSQVSNVLGTILPIKKIARKIRKAGNETYFIVDAAQSAAHMPIDVRDIDCDFLVFSGHKLFAPSGIGILYGKKERMQLLDPMLVGSQMIRDVNREKATFSDIPQRFEAGTLPLEGIIGLGAALTYIEDIGFEAIQTHERDLLSYCFDKLSKISEIQILGPKDVKKRSGIISFQFDGIHPHDIAQILGEQNICIRAGHHCAMPLHTRLGISASARVSLSIYNTTEDINRLMGGLNTVSTLLRKS